MAAGYHISDTCLGRVAQWLERNALKMSFVKGRLTAIYAWEIEVAGSNPVRPSYLETKKTEMTKAIFLKGPLVMRQLTVIKALL